MQLSNHTDTGEFNANGIMLGYSSFNLAWLNELGIEPKLIFDIGSYDAGDAIRFKQRYPDAVVLTFEADPERAEKISKYITDFNIKLYRGAVCSTTGKTAFYPSVCNTKDAGDTHNAGERGGQGSMYKHTDHYRSTYPQIQQQENPIEIDCTRVDDLFGESYKEYVDLTHVIDLAHIDVEGAEYEVLLGLGDMRPKVIFIESLPHMFTGAATFEQTHNLLVKMGYELIKDCGADKLYLHVNYIFTK